MSKSKDLVLITGDLGYNVFDTIRRDFPDRFFNPGAAEMLMVGMGIGMAMEGKIPICYSMTPFVLYRPFELIRTYIDHENIPVKLIGAGRDKDYDWLGFSHWAIDDKAHMSGFKNIIQLWPKDTEEMIKLFPSVIYDRNPYYVNLSR